MNTLFNTGASSRWNLSYIESIVTEIKKVRYKKKPKKRGESVCVWGGGGGEVEKSESGDEKQKEKKKISERND